MTPAKILFNIFLLFNHQMKYMVLYWISKNLIKCANINCEKFKKNRREITMAVLIITYRMIKEYEKIYHVLETY